MNPKTATPEALCFREPSGRVKEFLLILGVAVSLIASARAGSKEMAASPSLNWYADREWNVSLWGTYVFPNKDYPTLDNSFFPVFTADRNLEADHAWGGGIDAKYFFWRYFGVGVEGYILDVNQHYPAGYIDFLNLNVNFERTVNKYQVVGSVLGTLTLRYPIDHSRFAPYVFAGGGQIFGGGQTVTINETSIPDPTFTQRSGGTTKTVGQFGGGLEVRITPHIGLIGDFSWNIIQGSSNDFGMVRTGINFAF